MERKFELINFQDISGFNKNKEYYEKNKHKHWQEWLKIDKIFSKSGRQGVVGIAKANSDDEYDKDVEFIFKFSKNVDYVMRQEYAMCCSANRMGTYLPHFCSGYGGVVAQINPRFNPKENNVDPFAPCKNFVEKEMVLFQRISHAKSLSTLIYNRKNPDAVYSSIKQILLALSIAQKKEKMGHYDLHSYNILTKKCDGNLVFLYVLDDENRFCVPTFGRLPIIIDYGFGYCKEMENAPFWGTLFHTDTGFYSDRFDPVTDCRLFLISLISELEEHDKTRSKDFKNIVKKVYAPLELDWDKGWEDWDNISCSDFIIEQIDEFNEVSELFENYDNYCLELIQSLVSLPLKPHRYDNVGTAYTAFLKEFIKFEEEIGNSYYTLYFLKGVVDSARSVKDRYLSTNEDVKKEAIREFENCIYERLRVISSYSTLTGVKAEKMLCALFVLANCIQGIAYDFMSGRDNKRRKSYKKLSVKTPEDIYGLLEYKIPSEYTFSEKSHIIVIDAVKEKAVKLNELTEDNITKLNDLDVFEKGNYLYELYK